MESLGSLGGTFEHLRKELAASNARETSLKTRVSKSVSELAKLEIKLQLEESSSTAGREMFGNWKMELERQKQSELQSFAKEVKRLQDINDHLQKNLEISGEKLAFAETSFRGAKAELQEISFLKERIAKSESAGAASLQKIDILFNMLKAAQAVQQNNRITLSEITEKVQSVCEERDSLLSRCLLLEKDNYNLKRAKSFRKEAQEEISPSSKLKNELVLKLKTSAHESKRACLDLEGRLSAVATSLENESPANKKACLRLRTEAKPRKEKDKNNDFGLPKVVPNEATNSLPHRKEEIPFTQSDRNIEELSIDELLSTYCS